MRTLALLALPLLFATTFAQDAPKAAEPYKPSEGGATADLLLRMLKTGKQKLHFWCQLHSDPKAGQQWVIKNTSAAAGTSTEFFSAWQVVKVEGDIAIVEYDNGRGFIAAFEVDLTKKPSDIANVKRAWVAKPGEKPEPATVMETPKPAPGGKGNPAVEPKTEDFKDLELAGQKWAGKIYSSSNSGWESRTWVVADAWFGGAVKTLSTAGKAQSGTELHSTSTKAKAWLKWEDLEKEAPKPKEAKPEEVKPEEK
ncbi:MAG: hypothetical protein KF754_15835 [Planctomycetes bacterium]|nr:hypothetical protein [Planctomycetota bacterium]